MGNISGSLKKVLRNVRTKQSLEKYLKECLLANEYKHIITIRRHGDKLFVYLKSSVALYELNLKKAAISKCLKEKGLVCEGLVFKVGA